MSAVADLPGPDAAARPRVIGMLGGMSWESTAEYYRLANELVAERLGGHHSARLLLYSLDFAAIEQMQASNQWHQAGEVLAEAAHVLTSAGAELLILCTNTMHKVVTHIESATSVPLLHIADATATAAKAMNVQHVGLLGTRYTMEEPFLREALQLHDLEVISPDPADRKTVNEIIFDELVHGITTSDSQAACLEVIDRLVHAGAEGVILGCTEIELLLVGIETEIPLFATTRLHVQAAIDEAITRAHDSCRQDGRTPAVGSPNRTG